jgi:hypothetical protein
MDLTSEREAAIFSAARRLPPNERASYLDGACAGDAALRRQIEELLEANESAGTFLVELAAGADAAVRGGAVLDLAATLRDPEAILQVGFSDGIYGHSKGGIAPSGWKCEHLPYLVEIDNWGVSRTPGQAGAGGIWVWGYDEISWFAHQSTQYRADWLKYAWDWVRKTDPSGFLEMPGSRTVSSPDIHWYYANNPSTAIPNGFGDEEAIRAIWTADSEEARPGKSAP